MKVLFFKHTDEINTTVKKLMNAQYPKIQLIEVLEMDKLMEMMTNDGPFSFIVMMIDNKFFEISEMYQAINETIGKRPFIFIGSTASMKSFITPNILENAETNFMLETPFSPDEFKQAVQNCLNWVKKEEFEESVLEFDKEDLHKMRLRNFYLFEKLPYDVYLELTPNKYGKVITNNKPYSHQLIQNYSRKNIKYLFLRKDEHLRFLDISIKNLLKLYDVKLVDKKKILLLHLKTVFYIQQFIRIISGSEDVVKLSHKFIDSVRDLIKVTENLNELLPSITESSSMTFTEHSLATAYICESILANMGWNADMSRDKLLLAAILQDIHLSNDEMIKIRSLNDPQFKKLSEEEQIEFKEHPQKAAQISLYFNGFSDVDFILKEQHEHPSGDGFPSGINSSGLTTISCIFILATSIASRLAGLGNDTAAYKEIMGNMKKIYFTGNFKEPMRALEKSLKK